MLIFAIFSSVKNIEAVNKSKKYQKKKTLLQFRKPMKTLVDKAIICILTKPVKKNIAKVSCRLLHVCSNACLFRVVYDINLVVLHIVSYFVVQNRNIAWYFQIPNPLKTNLITLHCRLWPSLVMKIYQLQSKSGFLPSFINGMLFLPFKNWLFMI